MSQKLGEVLLEKGLITKQNLKRALDAQLIFGGHLGTCMIELGYMDEKALGEVLSDTLGVNYVIPELLEDVPSAVLKLFSRKVAERFQAIPFKSHNDALHVAMVDPGDAPAVRELMRCSGHPIVPWVSPEFRIVSALERHYRIPQRTRFIKISQQIEEEDPPAPEARKKQPASLPDGAAGEAEAFTGRVLSRRVFA